MRKPGDHQNIVRNAIIGYLVVWAAIVITIGYVVIHFIRKFW